MNKQKYIWWIGHSKARIGAWTSKAKAQKAINRGLKEGFLNSQKKWQTIPYELVQCPRCNRSTSKYVVELLGECLCCDHIRTDCSLEDYK